MGYAELLDVLAVHRAKTSELLLMLRDALLEQQSGNPWFFEMEDFDGRRERVEKTLAGIEDLCRRRLPVNPNDSKDD